MCPQARKAFQVDSSLEPYPRFTTISLYRHNVGTTNDHAAELTFQQRLSHGLSHSALSACSAVAFVIRNLDGN
ncbi:MAG: hypothetical protein AUH43_05790 [Acidobacteria bacterium 13_1_40CM_65_14]|nr:MAG: hypothetical protein AUH43_05790 [Acidobacteria bacterium 13_1_40CM_65_14]OLC82003.1 MAG: hypothetical protein AUH72_08065 [Acidobacteria bacterium 13_1_40CM_4_65_8]OLE85695.1 MAG: hypothetical protein AUF76_00015 [Acidobacteria bacterium 13_1_20CM_2_65_9]